MEVGMANFQQSDTQSRRPDFFRHFAVNCGRNERKRKRERPSVTWPSMNSPKYNESLRKPLRSSMGRETRS